MKLADIKQPNWSLSLEHDGKIVEGLDEISQCIRIITTTKKGSDPLRPGFGNDYYLYIDRPINEALPRMIKSTAEALERWETRISVTKITYNTDVIGAVEFTIYWIENTTQQTSSTKVLINGTN